MQKILLPVLIILACLTIFLATHAESKSNMLPEGFVFLTDVDPTIIESVRYYSHENFMGRPVKGYTVEKIICTRKAAEKLKLVHDDLKKKGYTLVVYDGYRPKRSVKAFIKWIKNAEDQLAKHKYYPTVDKKDLLKLNFIADEKPSHSRGSTFDLTLLKSDQSLTPVLAQNRTLSNGDEIIFLDDNTVDMGSSFDLFHRASHHDSKLIDPKFIERRNILRNAMIAHGFDEYLEEWWHYTLKDEPYPEKYFDFVLKKDSYKDYE